MIGTITNHDIGIRVKVGPLLLQYMEKIKAKEEWGCCGAQVPSAKVSGQSGDGVIEAWAHQTRIFNLRPRLGRILPTQVDKRVIAPTVRIRAEAMCGHQLT